MTLRDEIVTALVTRLQTLEGWTVQLRGVTNPANVPISAIVYYVAEEKERANTSAYDCTLIVGIEVTARIEDADPTLDGGNPLRYLDRLVGQVEDLLHSADEWGPQPGFSDVHIDGHDVADLEEEIPTNVAALVRLRMQYRHNIGGAA